MGTHYVVVGMSIWENRLEFLIRDDTGHPGFYAAALFECTGQRIPPTWVFATGPGLRAEGRELWSNPQAAVWGYEELVRDPDHAGALEEADEAAHMIFFKELMRHEQELQEEGQEWDYHS